MVMCNDHRPLILCSEVRQDFSIIQSSVLRFIDALEKAVDAVETNRQKMAAIAENRETKPPMTLKEKRAVYRQIEKVFIKYQQLFVTIKIRKIDKYEKNVSIRHHREPPSRRQSVSPASWYRVEGIVDDNQFKVGWTQTFNFDKFPWKYIKFKLWDQKE